MCSLTGYLLLGQRVKRLLNFGQTGGVQGQVDQAVELFDGQGFQARRQKGNSRSNLRRATLLTVGQCQVTVNPMVGQEPL